jgi:hypothetical protein
LPIVEQSATATPLQFGGQYPLFPRENLASIVEKCGWAFELDRFIICRAIIDRPLNLIALLFAERSAIKLQNEKECFRESRLGLYIVLFKISSYKMRRNASVSLDWAFQQVRTGIRSAL